MDDDCLASKCSPRKDPVEFSHCLALVFLCLGMLLVTVAFLVPRDYIFDPDLPASEMEAIEQYYSDRGAVLDVCLVIGTVFVGLGGLIIAGIFMVMLIQGDFKVCFNQEEEEDKKKCIDDGRTGYGSVGDEDILADASSKVTATKTSQ